MTVKYTPQQDRVVEAVRSSTDSFVVKSVAGSGKTSTGVAAVRALDPLIPTTALAFNKRNAQDLMMKMPEYVTCKTFNALGFRSWIKRAHKGKVDTKKPFKIRDQLRINYDVWPEFGRVLSMIRAYGLVPPNAVIPAKGLIPWDEMFLHEMIDARNLWPEVWIEEWPGVLEEAMRISIKMAWDGMIDFDDQIYMPALWDGPFDRTDRLIIDEVQDVSPIQRKLIHQVLGGKYRTPQQCLLALGDEHQAIYGFRGADHLSIEHFIEEFSCEVLPLTVSFRCPKAVTREAKKYVPEMEPHPSAPEGLVEDLGCYVPDFKPGDAILCRNNQPLIKLAFRLIKQHKPAKVIGRDIGQSIEKLAKKMKSVRTDDLMREVMEYGRQETAKLQMKGRHGAAGHLQDRVDSLVALCESLGNVSVNDLYDLIDRMFSEGTSPITLSTVHRSKGLEWDRVYFLDRNLIPSRHAQSEMEITQEFNIAYVGVTRAKKELYYIESEA